MIKSNYIYNNIYDNIIKKKWNNLNNVMVDKKEIIIINNDMYESTVGLSISLQTRNITSPFYNSHLISQIIGHILGDGCLALSWSSKNPYFIFTQGFKRFKYAWSVFNNISFLCKSMPKLGKSNRKGNISWNIQILTRSYPFLKDLYDVFYIKGVNNKWIKIVPTEMYYWLNPIVLAYWSMDDGGNTSSGSGFYLHTKGFDFKSVYYLVGILHYKLGIICTVQDHENRPVIYITAKSKKRFIEMVRPYFHETLLYKLQ